MHRQFWPISTSRKTDPQNHHTRAKGSSSTDLWFRAKHPRLIAFEDHCEAIATVLEKGNAGEVYNVSAGNEIPNIEIAKRIVALLHKPENLITFVEDRPDMTHATV